VTKILIFGEIYEVCTFNEKWHSGGKILCILAVIRSTQFRMAKKWQNSGFLAKFLMKFALLINKK